MPNYYFDTPLGTMSLTWEGHKLTAVQLPDPANAPASAQSSAGATPGWIRQLAKRVQRHLSGDFQDFGEPPYDFGRVTTFQAEVYRASLRVLAGDVISYGDLAVSMGRPRSHSRAVGSALGSNPWPLLIPCHRFVSATGQLTGYSAPGGIETKRRLLQLEKAMFKGERLVE